MYDQRHYQNPQEHMNGVPKMEETLVNELINLGLSSYEARAYITLLKLGEATAPSIAEGAKIPLTRVYDILSSLEEKGLVMVVYQRPKLYRALEPRLALNNLVSHFENRLQAEINKKKELAKMLIEKLESMQSKGYEKNVLDTFIIKGRVAIRNKAIEILNESSNIVRVAGYKPFLVIDCVDLIEHLGTRKLQVKVLGTLTEKCIKLFEKFGIIYKKYPFTYSSMIIVDDKDILIILTPGREAIALYSTNNDLVRAHIEFFERLWKET